jgi:cyanophycinase
MPDLPPPKPAALVEYPTGSLTDAAVTPKGPALLLMGGGADVDAAFQSWSPIVNGGDVVVLRTSGADGYNDYLFTQIAGLSSVDTMMVTTQALANDPYVAWKIDHAEGIFIAGGDQSVYLSQWKGTALQTSLAKAYQRGAAIGGTSAGCAILGRFEYAAYNGTVQSAEALADPYTSRVTLDRDFVSFAPTQSVITDPHFAKRDRMGRLVTFLARLQQDAWSNQPVGLGIDEATALLVDSTGLGTVVGAGHVYVLRPTASPSLCKAGSPLEYAGLEDRRLSAGDTVSLPTGDAPGNATSLSASAGALSPANPY